MPDSEQRVEPAVDPNETRPFRAFAVWDGTTRWLHAINAGLIFVLLFSGFFFNYRGLVHIDSREAKMAMKAAHSLVGYLFAFGLALRLLWGFVGNRFARFKEVLPTMESIKQAPVEARDLLEKRRGRVYLGHGPLGRLSSTALLLISLIVVSSGLVRAGTDLYYPPFGGMIASYVAKDGVEPSALTWKSKDATDEYKKWRVSTVALPMGRIHWYGSWVLILLISLHVIGVVLKELRSGGSVFSSMITGKKLYRPEDVADLDKAVD